MVRRWWVALPTLVPRLLSPLRVRRALETLRYPRYEDASLPSAEIINFVVVPAARGRGVAIALFGCLMQWFKANGYTAVKIVTGEQQVRAHGFYEKVGGQLRGQMSIHRGSLSRIYVYPIGDSPQLT
jgi:GNAT superfamily N-acetyltransferase